MDEPNQTKQERTKEQLRLSRQDCRDLVGMKTIWRSFRAERSLRFVEGAAACHVTTMSPCWTFLSLADQSDGPPPPRLELTPLLLPFPRHAPPPAPR